MKHVLCWILCLTLVLGCCPAWAEEPAAPRQQTLAETAPAEAVPAEEAVQQEPGQTGSDEYTVAEGDNLWQIALKTTGNGNMYLAIADANGLEEPYELTIGQKLIIPEVVPVG